MARSSEEAMTLRTASERALRERLTSETAGAILEAARRCGLDVLAAEAEATCNRSTHATVLELLAQRRRAEAERHDAVAALRLRRGDEPKLVQRAYRDARVVRDSRCLIGWAPAGVGRPRIQR